MEKINVTRSSMPPFEEYINTIKPLWETRWLTNCGEIHNQLRLELEKYLEVDNVSLFTNGHLALYTAINSLNLTGEVITTPYTFVSTTNAIVQNGLTPVFCDINPIDYTIDVNKIESLITDKTCAIVAVHVYGNICNVEKIEEIAKKYNLKVIYDAAHAFGVRYKGKTIGNHGDISMLSFHATKVFHTIEGGALMYKNNNLTEKLSHLRNFGLINPEECMYAGMNSKMNEFQAAMGLCNLKYIDENINKRRILVERYQNQLKDIEGIKFWQKQEHVESNYIYFPIIIEDNYKLSREELISLLAKNNIITRKYFYPLTSDFEYYKNYKSNTPIAKEIADKVLTLPLYSDLEIETVDKICKIIKEGV